MVEGIRRKMSSPLASVAPDEGRSPVGGSVNVPHDIKVGDMSDKDAFVESRGSVAQLRRRPANSTTIYDEIGHLLVDRGWVRGVERRGRALSLRAAINEAVGIDSSGRRAPGGAMLGRAGRVGAHLRDLTGARNLDAWSDEPERTLDEIQRLLGSAAVGFADD
jgi:hypothetical protein